MIGYIGLGFMGHGMAKNIRAGGHDLWVRGRSNRAPVDSLLALGAKEAASPRAMAETCDIIHISLSNSPQTIRDVISPSRMGNGFFETFMGYVVDRNRDSHKFSIANAAKDMRYLNDMASDANIMAGAAKHYYTHVEANGHAEDYVPMLSDHVGRLNGVDMAEVVRKGGT